MADLEAAKQTMIDNLPARTGRALPEWIELIRASGLQKHGAIMKLLKGDHSVTHGFANLISHEARGSFAATARSAAGKSAAEPDLVETQYAGKKAALRPILDAVLEIVAKFGDDIQVAPKKSSVSLRRNKQFALVAPTTNTRVDIGIQLKGDEPTERLEVAKGGMTSHRVRITDASQIDAELIAWLKEAYSRA